MDVYINSFELLKNIFVYGIGISFYLFFNFLSNFLINKNLEGNEIGRFIFNFGLFQILGSLFTVSLPHAYLRFFNESSHYGSYLIRKISFFSTIILFISVFFYYESFYISSLVFIVLFNERILYFRSTNNVFKFNLYKISVSFSILISLFIVSKFFNYLFTQNTISVIHGFWYFLFSFGGVKSFVFKNDFFVEIKKLLLYTFPILLTEIISWFYAYINQIFIISSLSPKDLTIYNISFKILLTLKSITTFFLLFFPQSYFQLAEVGNFSRIKLYRNIFILALSLTTFFSILFPKFLFILFGAEKYQENYQILQILLLSEYFRIVGAIFFIFQSFLKKTYYQTILTLFCLLILIFLNFDIIYNLNSFQLALNQLISSFCFFTFSISLNWYDEKTYFKKKDFI